MNYVSRPDYLVVQMIFPSISSGVFLQMYLWGHMFLAPLGMKAMPALVHGPSRLDARVDPREISKTPYSG